MAIDTPQQRKGLGSLLLRELESRACVLGAATIVLDARESALGFYCRHGYQALGAGHVLFGRTAQKEGMTLLNRELARLVRVAALTTQHGDHGICHLPGSCPAHRALDQHHSQGGFHAIPPGSEIQQALRVPEALDHDVPTPVRVADEQRGGYRKQFGHGGGETGDDRSHSMTSSVSIISPLVSMRMPVTPGTRAST